MVWGSLSNPFKPAKLKGTESAPYLIKVNNKQPQYIYYYLIDLLLTISDFMRIIWNYQAKSFSRTTIKWSIHRLLWILGFTDDFSFLGSN